MSLTDEGTCVEDLDSFHTWLMTAVERGPVAVITGKNGDMDTVGSAGCLSSIASSLNGLRAPLREGCKADG